MNPTATGVNTRPSSPALIAAAWLIVILPAAWGLEHTVQNAIKIFTKPPATTSAPAGNPAGTSH